MDKSSSSSSGSSGSGAPSDSSVAPQDSGSLPHELKELDVLDLDEAEVVKRGGPVGLPKRVVVHPLVLLSVVDHYNRVAKDINESAPKSKTPRRVCGVLLGTTGEGKVDITTSYAGTLLVTRSLAFARLRTG